MTRRRQRRPTPAGARQRSPSTVIPAQAGIYLLPSHRLLPPSRRLQPPSPALSTVIPAQARIYLLPSHRLQPPSLHPQPSSPHPQPSSPHPQPSFRRTPESTLRGATTAPPKPPEGYNNPPPTNAVRPGRRPPVSPFYRHPGTLNRHSGASRNLPSVITPPFAAIPVPSTAIPAPSTVIPAQAGISPTGSDGCTAQTTWSLRTDPDRNNATADLCRFCANFSKSARFRRKPG